MGRTSLLITKVKKSHYMVDDDGVCNLHSYALMLNVYTLHQIWM